MRAILIVLFGLFGVIASSVAEARHEGRVALGVRDLDSGRQLDTHYYDGERFLAGERGHRYAVTLQNLTPRRLLVVLSVDGVNVVSGESAAPDQAGYVLGPWQNAEIKGWRKSLQDVAAFRFTALSRSYAARTGRPDNVGVIGIAVFEEARPAPLPYRGPPVAKQAAPSAAAPQAEAGALADAEEKSHGRRAESLGTAHGERRYDPTRQTRFDRASRQPADVQQLFYDSRANLIAAGILPPPAYPRGPRRADPFPLGFVPDPY